MTAIRILRALTFALLAVALGLAAWRMRDHPEPLDDLGPLGPFTFTSSTGGTVSDADLKGKVCVYACFFTCCTESCPALTAMMAKLQHDVADLPDVRLVSLTVDPEKDTPEKLAAYAETFGADPKRWLFLTGERAKVEAFVVGQLKRALVENKHSDVTPGNQFVHTDQLALVDRAGNIRGWFPGTTADGIDKLEEAIRRLHR